MSHLMSKPGFATIFTIPTGMLNHLCNETRADQTKQMYRMSFPIVKDYGINWYFGGKLEPRHIYGTAGTHRRLNPWT